MSLVKTGAERRCVRDAEEEQIEMQAGYRNGFWFYP